MKRMATPEIVAFEDWLPGQPAVKETLDRIHCIQGSPASNHVGSEGFESVPGYLGFGRDKHAFQVGAHVLKIPVRNPESSFDSQINPLKRALGIAGVEQVVAVSDKSRTIVTDFMSGSMPAGLTGDALVRRYINPVSIAALQTTLGEMQEVGIFVDGPTNLLASGKRFGIIDPVDNPSYGVNDFDAVVGLIAELRLVAPGKVGDRPVEEYSEIWNAI